MKKQAEKIVPVNLKEANALHQFRLTIRDEAHFYKVVNWLNSNVGKGRDHWTFEGRQLKILRQGKSVSPMVYIFKPGFDPASALFLSLV